MPARSLQELYTLFQQVMTNADLNAVMACYEPHAARTGPAAELNTGHDSIRQSMSQFVPMKPDLKIDVERVISAGDVALIHGQWSMTTPSQVSGRYVDVTRRQPDGTWLFVVDDAFTLSA